MTTNQTWQLISTAPRDGTAILGAYFNKYKNCWVISTVSWFDTYWSLIVVGSYAEDSEWEPTHWMPLPRPPLDS